MKRALRFSLPTHFSFSFPLNFDLYKVLLFFFFFTLHADQLTTVIGGFSFRLNNAFAFLATCLLFIKRPAKCLEFSRTLSLIFLGIFTSLLLSGMLSPYRERCVLYCGWFLQTFVCYFLFPYLLIKEFGPKEILKLYFLSFFLTGLLALLQLILPFVGIPPYFASQQITGLFCRPCAFSYEPSFYALYMTPFIIIFQMHKQFNSEVSFILFKKVGTALFVFVHFLFLLCTATSTLFVYIFHAAFLFALSFSSFFQRRLRGIRKAALYSAVCFIFFMGISFLLFPDLTKRYFLKFFLMKFSAHHSYTMRSTGIHNAWEVFKEFPLFGIGYGGIQPHLFERWLQSDPSMQFGFQDLLVGQVDRILKFFEPANVFTELLASVGIFGALFWGLLIFYYCLTALKSIAACREKSEVVWNISFLISVLLMLIVLQFNQGLLRTYIWTHFAIAFAIAEKRATFPLRTDTSLPVQLQEE